MSRYGWMGEDDISYLIPIARAAHSSPLFSFISFFLSPIHARHSFLPLSLLSSFSSHLLRSPRTHTEMGKRERPSQESMRERERELLYGRREERRKRGFLESSVQSASTAPINDHPWSDRAEILQGGSQHVNLHCERWRSDLEQSAVIFLPVNSSSVLVVIFVEAN
jgi:hypothetical protein